jgi:DNA-binding transcriptional LysR family regulator
MDEPERRWPNAIGPGPRAELPWLRAFVAVARTGAVGRAAKLLGRTQPSISARIAALERAWDTRLFRRIARGMTPTPEGARLLPLVEAALRRLGDLERAAGIPISGEQGLRLGAGDALGRVLLPRALAGLLRDSPGLEIHVREGPGPRLLEALRAGEIDVALVVSTEAAGSVDDFDLRPLVRSPVDLLVPAGFHGRSGRSVPLRSLAGERLVVLQPGSSFRRHLEAAFAAASLPFHPAVEVGNLSLVRRFVSAGLGLAPVPAVAFEDDDPLAGVERRPVGGVAPVVYSWAVRPGVPLPAATHRLLERLERGRPG